MFPSNQNILIVADGISGTIESYATLAAALTEEGHRVRFLSYIEHEHFFQKMSRNSSSGTTFIPVQRSECKKADFITIMKNMSPELQQMVTHDPQLQVAMAKCDADKFIRLIKSMNDAREMCSSILDELSRCKPDLILSGHHCEYFGIYFKKMRNIPCINLLSVDASTSLSSSSSSSSSRATQQLTRWISLDNSVASLGLPRILSNLSDALKVNKMTVVEELNLMHCLELDSTDPDLLNDTVKSIERVMCGSTIHGVTKNDMLSSKTPYSQATATVA